MSKMDQNNTYIKNLLESMPVGVLIFDKTGVISYVTENFFRFKVSAYNGPEELIGKNVHEINVFKEIDIRKDFVDLRSGYGFEKTLINQKTLDGGQLSIIVKGSPVFKDDEYDGGIFLVEDAKISLENFQDTGKNLAELKGILNKVSDCSLITDSEGKIVEIFEGGNRKLIEALDCKIGDNIISVLPKKIADKLQLLYDENSSSLPGGFSGEFEKNDSLIRMNCNPLIKKNNRVESVIFAFHDKTDDESNLSKFNAEREELKKYQQIASSVVDAIVNVDMEGQITFWNESAEKLFGFTRSAVFGKFIGKILPVFNEKYFVQIKEELKKNKIWESRLKLGSADKTEYFQIRLGLLEEENPSIVILCTNNTRQVILERKLRQSEERFRDIVTNTREYICTIDLSGKITYVNPFFVSEFGYNENEFTGRNFTDLIERDYLRTNGFDLDLFDTESVQTVELPLLKKDESIAYVVGNFSIVSDLNDKPKYYNAILTDITNQKEIERDLLLIKSVFEASHEGIAVASKRKLVLVNERLVKMFGYDKTDELLGRDPLDMVSNEDIPRVARRIKELEESMNKPLVYEFEALRKDEATFYAENSAISYKSNNNLYLVSIIRDITEEKRSQLALTESEERYRSITENISESLWTAERVNDKLEMVFYTSGVKKITGYTQTEFLSNKRLWTKIIHPNDLSKTLSKFKRLYRDAVRIKDEIEYRIINKEGGIVWIKNKVNVVRNKTGKIEKVFGLVSDISLSKRAEEELRESASNMKKLNETKDKFISIVSHDLRTPFSSTIGFAELLLEPDLEPEKREQYARFILESSKSMLNLVNSLLDWTRLQTGRLNFEPARVNAKSIITNSYQMTSGAALNKNIQILNDVTTDVHIHGDSDLLLQVFNNLLSNAIKFTDSGGKIIINAFPLVNERKVKFSVKDDGVGIKKEDLDKLFKVESKFTLAGTAGEKGSGLGLSLCYDIVKKHGGDIWVESDFGKGTEFLFTIPISSTKILLVDDVVKDKILYSKLLKSILPNYTIETAENGKEAWEKIKMSQPALVISDHQMPVMSGYELVEKMSRERLSFKPPVIILGSDITEGTVEDYKALGVENVFNKPVEISQFKHAIEESLKKAIFT